MVLCSRGESEENYIEISEILETNPNAVLVSQSDSNSFLDNIRGGDMSSQLKIALEKLRKSEKIVYWNGIDDLEMVMVEVLGKLPQNLEVSVFNCAMKHQSKKVVNWLRKVVLCFTPLWCHHRQKNQGWKFLTPKIPEINFKVLLA